MNTLAQKFSSLQTLTPPAPSSASTTIHAPNKHATSLLDIEELHAMTPITFEIPPPPLIEPEIPSPHLQISDSDIFLDMNHETISESLESVRSTEQVVKDMPEHSLFAKVKADLSRWTKPHSDDVTNSIIKRELRHVKAVSRYQWFVILGCRESNREKIVCTNQSKFEQSK